MLRLVRQGALLLAPLLGMSAAWAADETAEQQAIPTVTKIGELPPPPAHEWTDIASDLNDQRANGNGLVYAPALNKYLNKLYAHMKAAAGVPDWPGAVYISADTTLNAHVSSSGNIYLHMGLIQSAETEDEIYSVMAHEFAHIYLNHQAAYEAHVMASNAAAGVKAILIGIFKKKAPGVTSGWGAHDSLALLDGVVHSSLIPVWQRDVEEQADMFAATLSLRERYSYSAGFKAFLERLATLEQRELESQPFPITAAAAAPADGRKTHATAREREEMLTAKMLPLIPKPRPNPRKKQWQDVVKEKETAEILAHFALLPQIAKLKASNNHVEALKLAQKAASGATAGDATMLLTLWDTMRSAGADMDSQRNVLLRNVAWQERAWSVQYQAAALTTPQQAALARTFLHEQYAYFGETPRTWPDMVGYYLRTDDKAALNLLTLKCATDGRFRESCIDRAQTDAQKKQAADEAAKRSENMGKKWSDKISDKLNLKGK